MRRRSIGRRLAIGLGALSALAIGVAMAEPAQAADTTVLGVVSSSQQSGAFGSEAAVSPDGPTAYAVIAGANGCGQLEALNTSDGGIQWSVTVPTTGGCPDPAVPAPLAVSADGSQLFLGTPAGILVFQLAAGTATASQLLPFTGVSALASSHGALYAAADLLTKSSAGTVTAATSSVAAWSETGLAKSWQVDGLSGAVDALAAAPDGSTVYASTVAAGGASGAVSAIATGSSSPAATTLTSFSAAAPLGVTVSPDGKTVYASVSDYSPLTGAGASDGVVPVAASSGAQAQAIPVTGVPLSGAFSADGSTLYVPTGPSIEGGGLDAIDTASSTVTTSVPLPAGGLAVVPATVAGAGLALFTGDSSTTLSVLGEGLPLTAPASVTVSGTMQATTTVTATATAADWSPGAVTLGYQWLGGAGRLAGGTTASLTVPTSTTVSDVFGDTSAVNALGTPLRVAVTASEPGYVDSVVYSSTAPIASLLVTSHKPTVKGYRRVGALLHAVIGDWSPANLVTYQWYMNGKPIKAQSKKSTFRLSPAQYNKKITVTVSINAPGYTPTSLSSGGTKLIAGGTPHMSKPALAVAGKPTVGKTVTAVESAIGIHGGTVTYQWYYGDGVQIAGATKATFKLTKAQLHRQVRVQVSVAKKGCPTATKVSALTAVVGPKK